MDEIKIPDCPPIFGVPPMALASADVESLCGFGMRLAQHNGVNPTRLFGHRGAKRKGAGFPHAFPSIAMRDRYATVTMSRDGRVIADLIADRTGITAAATLAWFNEHNAISLARLTVPFARWCPDCLLSDQTPYFRLAWEFLGVNCCRHHGLKLQKQCPACGKSILAFRSRAGNCPACGIDLATARYGQCKAPPEDLSRTRDLSRLIATISSDRRVLETCRPAQVLVEWAAAQGSTSIGAQARLFGVSKSTASSWNQGGNVSLASLLSTCLPLGLSPIEAMHGPITATMRTAPAFHSPWGNRRKVLPGNANLAGQLNVLAQSPFFPSLRQVATSLQLDRHCLRRANPAACAAIANRSVTVRRTLTRSQWLLFTAAIERRCDRLRSQHEVISSRTLTAEFHKHRIFLRPSHWNYVRQKLNMVREAAREEARASPTSAERRFN